MDVSKMLKGLSNSGALSGFMGGVAGGGLTSMLTSKKGKKMGKSALKVGALAAVGGLAWKAYQQYSENKGAQTASPAQQNDRFNIAPAQISQQDFEHVVEDSNESGQLLLMRAMISAAHSDGHIDDNERSRIFQQVDNMDLSVEDKATLFDEMRRPLNMQSLVAQVPNAQTGIEVYAASASALDLNQHNSQEYLQALASQLCIPSELSSSIHQQLQSS